MCFFGGDWLKSHLTQFTFLMLKHHFFRTKINKVTFHERQKCNFSLPSCFFSCNKTFQSCRSFCCNNKNIKGKKKMSCPNQKRMFHELNWEKSCLFWHEVQRSCYKMSKNSLFFIFRFNQKKLVIPPSLS